MNHDSGVEGVLSALAHFQCDEPIPQIITACGEAQTLSAASIRRAFEMDLLSEGVSEPEIVEALFSYTGRVGRRKILSHLRKNRIIQKDAPFQKLMHPGSAPSIKSIIRLAAEKNGRTYAEVLSESRRPESVMSRFEAAWICVKMFGFPVSGVSEMMGKNHTTILSGINKIDILIQRSPVRLDRLVDLADAADEDAVFRYCSLFAELKKGPEGPRLSLSS